MGWETMKTNPGHVGYSNLAAKTPEIRRRFASRISGVCECVTQIPIISLRDLSPRSLVSTTTVRLPESVIRWMPVDCLDDSLVLILDGVESL